MPASLEAHEAAGSAAPSVDAPRVQAEVRAAVDALDFDARY